MKGFDNIITIRKIIIIDQQIIKIYCDYNIEKVYKLKNKKHDVIIKKFKTVLK